MARNKKSMYLLGVESPTRTLVDGYLRVGKEYKSFVSKFDGVVEVKKAANVSDYSSYEHFANVIGKFNPWVVFLKEPVKVEGLEYNYLIEVIKEHPVLSKI